MKRKDTVLHCPEDNDSFLLLSLFLGEPRMLHMVSFQKESDVGSNYNSGILKNIILRSQALVLPIYISNQEGEESSAGC